MSAAAGKRKEGLYERGVPQSLCPSQLARLPELERCCFNRVRWVGGASCMFSLGPSAVARTERGANAENGMHADVGH